MNLFPFFTDISGRTALVIGGGNVAMRKAQKLSPFGVRLVVIAPEITEDMEKLDYVECIRRPFNADDIRTVRPAFVLAASGDRQANALAARLCRESGIPVNVADDISLCTFQFPSLVCRGDVTVGISTAGKSPSAAASMRGLIEQILPDDMEPLLDEMEKLRERLKRTVPEQPRRAAILRQSWNHALAYGKLPDNIGIGFVSLVGGGCGSKDLITLRGMRRLAACDAVVYDALIDPELLDIAPAGARRIPVGKRAGKHSATQAEINRLLIDLAKEGLNVVRLKGGDPYLFGRGGEEAEALSECGIGWEEIPGVPSAIAIPAEHGIPVTHRNVSRGLHIITAHTAEEELPEDLPQLAKLHGTLVFLMGLSRLKALAQGLIRNGMRSDMPAAVVSGGNAPQSYCIRGTLADIADKAADAQAPAVIVIGETAAIEL